MTDQVASRASVVRKGGEGEALWFLGGLYDIRVSSDESDGAASIVEFTLPENAGPPPHEHASDETLYVLEGRIRHHIGESSVEVGPGAVFFMPRGTLEWFEPVTRARVLAVYTPGGMDKFFKEAGEPAERREIPPPPAGPPDFERLAAIGAKHGLELKAPPEQ